MPQDRLDDDVDYHIAQYMPKHHQAQVLGHELDDNGDGGNGDDAVGDWDNGDNYDQKVQVQLHLSNELDGVDEGNNDGDGDYHDDDNWRVDEN